MRRPINPKPDTRYYVKGKDRSISQRHSPPRTKRSQRTLKAQRPQNMNPSLKNPCLVALKPQPSTENQQLSLLFNRLDRLDRLNNFNQSQPDIIPIRDTQNLPDPPRNRNLPTLKNPGNKLLQTKEGRNRRLSIVKQHRSTRPNHSLRNSNHHPRMPTRNKNRLADSNPNRSIAHA